MLAYVGDAAGRDLSLLDGAVAAGLYGGPDAIWNLDSLQACNERLEAGGVGIPEPAAVSEDESDIWVAGFTACRNMVLLQSLLEAAGEDLNYGSFAGAADGLEIDLPIQPDPMTYGPGEAADGDPTAYLFDWDPDEVAFVLREG